MLLLIYVRLMNSARASKIVEYKNVLRGINPHHSSAQRLRADHAQPPPRQAQQRQQLARQYVRTRLLILLQCVFTS